jgi:apolipoprotein N-acyltransferase
VLLAVVTAWCSYGVVSLAIRRATDSSMRVALVQTALTDYDARAADKGRLAVVEEILATHMQLSDRAAPAAVIDLLVWPETVYPTPFGSPKSELGARLDQVIARFVSQRNLPLYTESQTLVTRWGDWLGGFACLVPMGLVLSMIARWRW